MTRCPACRGAGEHYAPPVTVGEPQPEEWAPCRLCDGMGMVTDSAYRQWLRDNASPRDTPRATGHGRMYR